MSDNTLAGKRVLVAEDNAINQMVVKHTLAQLGIVADIAGDGCEVVEKFKNNQYDAVLMDIQMPLMDGYETTIYIRQQLQSNVPIIAMTAFSLDDNDNEYYKSGMNGYVTKPFTVESLGEALRKEIQPAKDENDAESHLIVSGDVVVDVSMLYDISGNDESFIKTMIETFAGNMPGTFAKIEQSLHEKDWEKVYKAAHFAKSSLSVIKVNDMYELAFSIEKNARNITDLETIPELFSRLKTRFDQAKQLLFKKYNISSLPQE
jgi:CheY-like chemotaxis protein